MEPILLIMAATYVISGKHSKDTAQSAYKAGKEPPGLVKARLRHEAGGGRFRTRPGKDKQPKGPGAGRLLIASRWSVACEKAKTKQEDKLRRWQAWYEEQAPDRDQAWRDKQTKKMNNRAERLDKWQGRWTRTKTAAAGAKDAARATLSSNKDDATEQPAESSTSEQPDQSPAPEPEPAPEPAAADTGADAPANPPASSPSTNTSSSQQEGDAVYQSGASTMHNHANEVEGYRKALTALGQDMADVNWGAEVHGPLADMHTKLKSVAARYRNLAETVKHQGDAVNDAYDEAPWSPDHKVLTQ